MLNVAYDRLHISTQNYTKLTPWLHIRDFQCKQVCFADLALCIFFLLQPVSSISQLNPGNIGPQTKKTEEKSETGKKMLNLVHLVTVGKQELVCLCKV